jgi:magnesium-protoporphyrin O-methyltransferase
LTGIDASSAYLEQCRLEAERRGYADRARHLFGDFTALHEEVEPADIVTLDRVICCFDDVETLVGRSVSKARRLYGLVYPREAWWTAFGFRLINFVQRLRRADFQVFLHPTQHVESMVSGRGFDRVFLRASFLWQVVLFESR